MNKQKLLSPFFVIFLVILIFSLPFLLLMMVGAIELYFTGLWLWWIGLTAICTLLSWLLLRQVAKPEILSSEELEDRLGPEPFWTESDLLAWEKVCVISDQVNSGTRAVISTKDLQHLGSELLDEISNFYYPNSTRPRLEVTLYDLLLINEQASRDLRELFVENVPLHDTLTIGDLLKGRKALDLSGDLFNLYRALRAVGSPLTALLAELQNILSRRAVSHISKNTAQWILARIVEGAGKHLINLYSGQVVDFLDFHDKKIDTRSARLAPNVDEAAIRIMLVGRTGSGKSSLINALFGEMRALVNHLPQTREILCYEKTLEGVGRVEILDTPGYSEADDPAQSLKQIQRELKDVDIVLLLVPANSAARKQDCEVIEAFRLWRDQEKLDRTPPLLTVVNKIDLLKPASSWNPPYDLLEPEKQQSSEDRTKASNIQNCVLAVAEDLNCDPAAVIPVMLKDAETAYNLDILVLLIGELLPEARRIVLRRMLKNYKDDKFWENLRKSIKRSGKIVLKKSLESVIDSARALARLTGD